MADYSGYEGKKVVVTDTSGETYEGVCEAGSELGIVVKLKNSAKSTLIESKNIDTVTEPAAAPKKLKPRSLPQIAEGKVRQHLLDRHGYAISDIEAMTEEEATAFHNGLDHEGLGHFHREPSAIEAEIAEAESDED